MIDENDFYWCMGFIEGEGSFTLQLHEVKNKNGSKLIRPHCIASLSSVEKDKAGVELLQKIFGGTLTFKSKECWIKKGILNAQNQIRWTLNSVEDANNFCQKVKDYVWKTTKGNNFNIWKEGVNLLYTKKYLTKEGLINYLDLREKLLGEIRNKNVKSKEYYLQIINEMEQRNFFTEENIIIRTILGSAVQEKAKKKWIKINSEGYSFGIDTRRL